MKKKKKKKTVPTTTKVTSTPALRIIIVLKVFDMENTIFHVLVIYVG